ncbi:MAG: DNA-formamidopyrimidine glycosylase [Bacilli bacterium]|nr:DNA-formamidopyrimidine glycosylase [Bacilli bacterium]
MPELPEVETVRKVLESWIVNKKITGINIIYPPIISNVTPSVFESKLIGQKIKEISRKGKFLIFILEKNVIISHLRMEGKYHYGHYSNNKKFTSGIIYDKETAKNDKNLKHVHVIFEFEDGSILMYHDVRKFGRMYLKGTDNYLKEEPLINLGPDPFEANSDYLFKKLQNTKKPLKQVLLNQKIISGIGNIYADEICFDCKLSPFSLTNSLSKFDCENIIFSARKILNKAIESGGSTIRTYHAANGVDGKFQLQIKVYGREGEECYNCNTPIVKTSLGGRGTHFCPQCQAKKINSKNIRIIGITGLIGSGKSSVSNLFKNEGFIILDSDIYSKEALNIGTKSYNQSIERFSSAILNDDKTINRSVLREIVIKDKQNIIDLENIIHPYVIEKTKNEIKNNIDKYIILDVPLLYESKMDKLCDFVVFVNIDEKIRKKRLIQRDTMPLKHAKDLNKRVISDTEKIKMADYIIDNSLSIENTKNQVKYLINKIK